MNKYDAISKLIQSICKLGSDRNAQNLENTKSLFAQLSLQFRHDPQTFRKLITLVYFDQIMSINEMACSIGVHGSEIEPLVGDYFTSECLSCQEDIYFFADSIEARDKFWNDHENFENNGEPEITEYLIHHAREHFCDICWAEIADKWYMSHLDKEQLDYIKELRTMPYQEYLKTDHWQDCRKQAIKRAKHRCQLCNSRTKLNVHHRTYERRGHERDDDLITLCESCHSIFHQASKLAKR